MSWSIDEIGYVKSVRSGIDKTRKYPPCPDLPEEVRRLLLAHCQDEPTTNGISIKGHGHRYEGENSYQSGIDLKIERFRLRDE